MTGVPDELDRRFREAAAAEGLLDVAYDVTDSPIGPLLVAASERGLCRISFDPEPEHELEALARAFGPRVLRSASPIDRARRELDEYFEGTRQDFDLAVDLTPLPDFQRRVLEELIRVSYGHVDTYGGLGAARRASTRGTRGRRGAQPQPDPDRRAVPPDRRLHGKPRRLCRRPGDQAGAPRARGRDPSRIAARLGGLAGPGLHPAKKLATKLLAGEAARVARVGDEKMERRAVLGGADGRRSRRGLGRAGARRPRPRRCAGRGDGDSTPCSSRGRSRARLRKSRTVGGA